MSCWNLIIISLYLYINLGRINIFSLFSLPIHEHSMSLHLFTSLVSFIRIIQFSVCGPCTCSQVYTQVCVLNDYHIGFFILMSMYLLLICRKPTDFSMFIIFLITLLNLLTCFGNFFLDSLGFSIWIIMSSASRGSFISSFLIYVLLISFFQPYCTGQTLHYSELTSFLCSQPQEEKSFTINCKIFKIAKKSKQPKCQLIDEWLKKVWYFEYYYSEHGCENIFLRLCF